MCAGGAEVGSSGRTARHDTSVLVQRIAGQATIGLFPWRFVDGESSIGRCVAMVEGDEYEELMTLKAGMPNTRFGDGYNPAHMDSVEWLTQRF